MWVESCHLPDNTFSGPNIQLPEKLRNEVSSQAREELMNCFISSLHIDTPDENFKNIFIQVLKDVWKQEFHLLSVLDNDYMENILYQAVQEYYTTLPAWSVLDPENSYIVVNGYVFHYSHISNDNESSFAPEISPRPQSRPEDLMNQYFAFLEGDTWLQKDKNNELTLADAYKQYGFPEDLQHAVHLFSSEIYGKSVELTPLQMAQVQKLISFVLKVESYGGYNVVLDDRVRTSGYYQFQVLDGKWGKEKYDFETQTFHDAGKWEDGDKGVKIVKWKNKRWVRKVRRLSSYEQALNSVPDSILQLLPSLQAQRRYIGEPQNQRPEALSTTEQTILFLSNIYFKWGERSKTLFKKIISGNNEAIIDLYREIHHWDLSNKDTLGAVRRVAKELGIAYS